MSEMQQVGTEHAVLKLMRQLVAEAANEKTAEVNNTHTFSDMVKASLNKVNQHQMTSAKLQKAFEVGEATLPEVIVAMQKASVSFTAIKEVRNKLIDAYRQIMNMPV